MAKRQGHISRRELLARSIAFGGVAMVGSFTKLFGQEARPEGHPSAHSGGTSRRSSCEPPRRVTDVRRPGLR
jgi:hypothetical protein